MGRFIRFSVFGFIAILLANPCAAQQYIFEPLSYDQGLPSNSITDFAQDSAGFIWLASSKGLIRFDGSNYSNYPNRTLGNDYFPGSTAEKLFTDVNGGIWTSTRAGAILSYEPLKDRFIVRNDSSDRLPDGAYTYHQDTQGRFWFGFRNHGILQWDSINGILNDHKAYQSWDSLPSNTVSRISSQYDTLLYITTARGTSFYNPRTKKFIRLWFNAANGDTYKHNVVRDAYRNDDFAYTATFGGLHITDLKTRQIKHIYEIEDDRNTINHNSIWGITEAVDGKIWMATYGGGINIYDPQTSTFEYVTTDNSNLPSDNLLGIFKDRDGSIWVQTEGSGIAKVDPRKQWIKGIYLKSNQIKTPTCVFRSNDSTIWIGTNGNGLLRYNLVNNSYKQFTNDPEDPSSLAYDNVTSLDMDDDGYLWVATAGGGLDRLDMSSETFVHHIYRPDNLGISNMSVKFVTCIDSLIFYATYGNGFGYYNRATNAYHSFWNRSDLNTSVDMRVPNFMYRDSKNNLWIPCEGGLIVYDPVDQKYFDIIYPENADVPLNSFNITSIHELSEDRLIILTSNGELLMINYQGNGNATFNIPEVPSSIRPGDILYVDDSLTWFIQPNGLVGWDKSRDSLFTISKKDGLLANQNYMNFNQPGYPLYLPSTNGLSIVFSKDIPELEIRPTARIQAMSVLNKPLTISSTDSNSTDGLDFAPNFTDNISLEYSDKEFTIEFSAIQFYAINGAAYRYRLKGFRDEWVETSNANSVSYTNLDPGKYTFEVQAGVIPGIWGPTKSLGVSIKPPFWRTWWFISMVLIAIGLILYYLHKKSIEKAIAIANLRTQIAQDLHDDLGSSLTKISLFSSLLQETNNGSSSDVADQLGELSREAVSQMSDIVWSVDQKNDSLGDLVSHMRFFAIDTLEKCDISVNFEKSIGRENIQLNPLVRQNYYLIFKEAINNICKHSKAKHVDIKVTSVGNLLSLSIKDDGIGFTSDSKNDQSHMGGNGLGNMQKRAERIGLNFTIKLNETGGTQILVNPT